MKNFKSLKFALITLAFLTACVSAVKYGSGSREPASAIPSGLKGDDLHDYYHMSEGADIYPYEWLLALKTVNFKWKGGNYSFDEDAAIERPFMESLDWKHGLLRAPTEDNDYVLDWSGLTVGWSNHVPSKVDAKKSDREYSNPPSFDARKISRTVDDVLVFDTQQGKMVRKNSVRSVRMVGTNCALCHTGEVENRGQKYRIDGGPNMVNVRGFFQDMATSTLAVLAKKDLLEGFLSHFSAVKDPQKTSEELVDAFLLDFGRNTRLGGITWGNSITPLVRLSAAKTLLAAKKAGDRTWLYRGSGAIGRALERLLRTTYGFGPDEEIGELKQRMEYFGRLMVGTNPANKETPSGFGRTDAFGRIGNLVLRGDNPIDYTAPVSLPWMWGLKYQAMLHYTANTNSVILRNVGQSLGLGAQIFATKNADGTSSIHGSTVNIHNLDQLEKLIHKIKVPQWTEVFGERTDELRIRKDLAKRGKEIYEHKCAWCHTSKREAGPARGLYEYRVRPLDEIGTDKYAALNCAKPIRDAKGHEGVFQEAILGGTVEVKTRYYEQYTIEGLLNTRGGLGIRKEDQEILEYAQLRGKEFFRDTLYGTSSDQVGNGYGVLTSKTQPGYKPWGYQARHLAGVWATAPYLHNGSVPNMRELLKPAINRVKIFNVRSREIDPYNLGFVSERETQKNTIGLPKPIPCQPKLDDKCFDVSLAGNSNSGHESARGDTRDPYGTFLSEPDKDALIEYLKILPPEPEYGDTHSGAILE